MNLVYGFALHEFSVARVDKAPARCLGGHRFESCQGLKFFLCPTLMTCCRLFHFHTVSFVQPGSHMPPPTFSFRLFMFRDVRAVSQIVPAFITPQ